MKPVLVSGEYPFLAARLRQAGYDPIVTEADRRLPEPVRFHPDMQLCRLEETLFVLAGSPLRDKLAALGLPVVETERGPESAYPGDVLCNAFVLGKYLVGNREGLDRRLLETAQREGLELLHVRQGYAACSAAVVDETSVITADKGIADALERKEISVLRIRAGHLELPGYNTGFFGGCCGSPEPGVMVFTGALVRHPDAPAIKAFLKERNIRILELSDGPLLDTGGIKHLF